MSREAERAAARLPNLGWYPSDHDRYDFMLLAWFIKGMDFASAPASHDFDAKYPGWFEEYSFDRDGLHFLECDELRDLIVSSCNEILNPEVPLEWDEIMMRRRSAR